MLIDSIKKPTHDQIRDNAKVAEDDHEVAFACWYPQMGGYVGECVVVLSKESNLCFTALVWHDGEFPFDDDDPRGRRASRIHHCAAEQFVEFGALVGALQRASLAPT